MSVSLHKVAIAHAEKTINAGEIAAFDTNWEAEKPTPDEVNHFIDTHYLSEYGLWFLGVDSKFAKDVKEHYVYPYGDLKVVQRSALVDTIKRAEKSGHAEIVKEAKRLLEIVDKKVAKGKI